MQERNINLNSIIGMDLRDFNLEQQYVTELVNLVKDKNGWKIRNPIKSIWTIPTDLQAYDIQNLFKKDTTAIIHIGNSILFYKIENNTISEFIKRYDYNFSFKLFETNFQNVYYMIDQTNSKNYILEFTDRLGVWIDDVGSPDLSTELLYHEYDTYTGDTIWGAFGKYKGYENNLTAAGFGTMSNATTIVNVNGVNVTYNTMVLTTGTTAQLSVGNIINVNSNVRAITAILNSNTVVVNASAPATNSSFNVFSTLNGQTYNNHLNTYLVNYDANNVADMYVKDYINGDDIHLSVTQDNNRTRFQMTNPGEVQPEQWVDRVDYTGNVFGGLYSKYMDAQIDQNSYGSLVLTNTNFSFNETIISETENFILTADSIYKKNNDIYTLFYKIHLSTNEYVSSITEDNNNIYYIKILGGSSTVNSLYRTNGVSEELIYQKTTSLPIYASEVSNEQFYFAIPWVSAPDYGMNIYCYNIIAQSETLIYNGTQCLLTNQTGFKFIKAFNYLYILPFANGTNINIIKLNPLTNTYSTITINNSNDSLQKLFILNKCFQIVNNKIYIASHWSYSTYATDYSNFGYIDSSDNVALLKENMYGDQTSFNLYSLKYYKNYMYLAITDGLLQINLTAYAENLISVANTPNQLHLFNNKLYLTTAEKFNYTLFQNNHTNYDIYAPITESGPAYKVYKYAVNTVAKTVTRSEYSELSGVPIQLKITQFYNDEMNISYVVAIANQNTITCRILNKQLDVNNLETADVDTAPFTEFNLFDMYGLDIKKHIYTDTEFINRCVVVGANKIYTIDLSLAKGSSNLSYSINYAKFTLPTNLTITQNCNVTLGNIDPLTNRQRVYVTQGKEIWVFTLEDGVMLDTNEYFDKYTIPTISRYADVDGGILSHKLINEDGYVLTEINQSKKIPIRPYFSPKYINVNGTATLDTLYAVTENIPVNQIPTYQHETMPTGTFTTLTATMTVSGTTVTITGGDATQLFKIGDVIKDSAGTMRRITNIYNTTSIGCVSGLATGTGAIQLSTDKWELNQLYGYRENNLIKYRTPVDIDNGSYFNPLSDNNVNYYQYWMMYILNAGLLDDDFIDEINLTVGKRKGGNYDLYYWAENPQYVEKHYGANSTQVDLTGLPFVFSNKAVNDTDSTNVNYIFCKNNKVFWRINDRLTDNNVAYRGYQDGFYGVSFWETKQAQRWLIQDLVYFANDLVFALDYDGKLFNYSYGIKLLDRSAYKGLTSKPVGIYEYSNGKTVTICENDIYVQDLFSGANYDTILNQKIATNIGIEKNNYNAIVSNGVQTFFENKNGVYMISNNNLVNIGLPIEDYLYKDAAIGKRLGIDTGKGIMLIPLDANKINNINIEYKNGDYGTATADGNIIYDKYIGVYNYIDNAWSIWAFNSNTDGRQAMESFDAMPMIRVNNALVIPDFRRYTTTELASATENPIARIIFKRTSMGDVFGLTLLRYLLAKYKNNLTNGVDYVKIKYNINDSVDYTVRYGDFRGTGYTEYSKLLVPDNTTTGWTEFILPMDIDFRTLRMALEFGRIKDSVYADVSLTDIALDTIDKSRRRLGFN